MTEKPNIYNARDFGAAGRAVVAYQVRQNKPYYPGQEKTEYDIRDRADDSQPLDSLGIQSAIDEAHKHGGGTVVVPAGDYIIGPVEMKSHVCLRLEAGCRLWGSPRLEDYYSPLGPDLNTILDGCTGNGLPRESSEEYRRIRRLLYANGAEHFAVEGPGMINGQSPAYGVPWTNSEQKEEDFIKKPREMLLFNRCRKFQLRDLYIVDSPWWTCVLCHCEQVQIRGLNIDNWDSAQSDGIDLHDCQSVTISDCLIHAPDDNICLKNVHPEEVVRDVTITNCVLRTYCNAIKIGSNSRGLFEDISITNIVIANQEKDPIQASAGINLSSIDGGIVRRVNTQNVQMRMTKCPFYIVAGKRHSTQKDGGPFRAGKMEDISISAIVSKGAVFPCFVSGHPEDPIESVRIRDITLADYKGPLGPSKIESPSWDEEEYPRPAMYGELPVAGFYGRKVLGLTMENWDLRTRGPVERPAFLLEECSKENLRQIRLNYEPCEI